MKLAAFADMQMGSHPQYGGPAGRLAEQEQVLRRILETARDEDVDCVVFAGDAFHHRSPSPDEILAWERPLVEHRALGGPRVYAIPGNHDLKNSTLGCALDAFHLADLLTLFREPATVYESGVALAFLPWTATHHLVAEFGGGNRDDLNGLAAAHLHKIAAGLALSLEDEASLLVTHFAIDGDQDGFSRLVREPVLDPHVLAESFAFTIAGHFERPQLVTPTVMYCGSPYPVDFGQGDYEHGMWIVEVDADSEVVGRFVPIESRPLVTIDYDFDGFYSIEDEIARAEWREGIVRVRYTATADQAQRIDQREIRQALLDAGAAKVFIVPTILREDRARVERIDETIDDLAAFELWLDARGIDTSRRDGLRDLASRYLEATA